MFAATTELGQYPGAAYGLEDQDTTLSESVS